MLQIDQSSGLYVKGAGNVARFASVFAETWRRLPDATRETLVLYWWKRGVPIIRLVDDQTRWERPALGCCSPKAAGLYFLQPFVDAMPDKPLSSLIAHELAHAFVEVVGMAGDGWREEERQAVLLALSWGFDLVDTTLWFAGNIVNPKATDRLELRAEPRYLDSYQIHAIEAAKCTGPF